MSVQTAVRSGVQGAWLDSLFNEVTDDRTKPCHRETFDSRVELEIRMQPCADRLELAHAVGVVDDVRLATLLEQLGDKEDMDLPDYIIVCTAEILTKGFLDRSPQDGRLVTN